MLYWVTGMKGWDQESPTGSQTERYRSDWEEPAAVLAARVASRFDLPWPIEAFEFPDRGNINQHTYMIRVCKEVSPSEYLLQQINPRVFTRPDRVMDSMIACLNAQREALARHPERAEGWQPITLIPTRRGAPFLVMNDRRGRSYWRMMVRIADCHAYKSLGEIADRRRRLAVAEEAGRGLAIYGDLTADLDTARLRDPLPGYRDTRLYYAQLDSVLAGHRSIGEAQALLPADPDLLASAGEHFLVHLPPESQRRRRDDPEVRGMVETALAHRDFATTLLRKMENGQIRRVAIHGDTKLDNFLFDDRTGRVKSLVDLDTIMPHTWLADWGDMVRSLGNVAGEKEPDPSRVAVDPGIFGALAKGFLGAAHRALKAEKELMVEAAQILTLELGLRFLTDYLRGDNYFRRSDADPPDLNKIRARVQLRLFEALRESEPELRRAVEEVEGKGCG